VTFFSCSKTSSATSKFKSNCLRFTNLTDSILQTQTVSILNFSNARACTYVATSADPDPSGTS
jgi:hypothetical protein